MIIVKRVLKNYLANPDQAHAWGDKLAAAGFSVQYKVGDASQYMIEARIGTPSTGKAG
jgi:hypothetical protein